LTADCLIFPVACHFSGEELGLFSRTRRMTKSFSLKQLVSLPAGAVVLLLGFAVLAPPSALGGCSHLVTSGTDPGRLSSPIEGLIHDLAGKAAGLPAPVRPRPCSGALCSGQPAAPSVPPGLFDGRLESWVWCASVPGLVLIGDSFLFAETNGVLPTRRSLDVFHPPRFITPA
jgi:hypothetical protein